MVLVRLYRKEKKEFVLVEDVTSIKVGNIVKVFSEKSNKFINKEPYFVHKIEGSKIQLQQSNRLCVYDTEANCFSLK